MSLRSFLHAWAILLVFVCTSLFGIAHASELTDESIRILEQSSAGRSLIQSAEIQIQKPIRSVIVDDRISHTDAVISRTYDPVNHIERKERRVSIHLNVFQDPVLRALDLAHELSHASASPAWDPYDPQLSLIRYIQIAIEGEGGEALAVQSECLVAMELESKFEVPSHRCDRYIRRMNTIGLDRVLIKEDFYRVGGSYEAFQEILGESIRLFPALSSKRPVFISSTGNAPYPVALAKEYLGITESACKNTLRRIQSRQMMEPHEKDLIERRCRSFAAPSADS